MASHMRPRHPVYRHPRSQHSLSFSKTSLDPRLRIEAFTKLDFGCGHPAFLETYQTASVAGNFRISNLLLHEFRGEASVNCPRILSMYLRR